MNETLSQAAIRALRAPHFVTLPHHCQEFIRQVVQSVYGPQFDAFWRSTAAATGRAFDSNSHFVVPLIHGSTVGDLLYKLQGSGGDGHVGIRIDGNRVAENSSVHWDGHDARGTRSLIEFGHYDLIVRLPAPSGTYPLNL